MTQWLGNVWVVYFQALIHLSGIQTHHLASIKEEESGANIRTGINPALNKRGMKFSHGSVGNCWSSQRIPLKTQGIAPNISFFTEHKST